jgi:hypothetical protein
MRTATHRNHGYLSCLESGLPGDQVFPVLVGAQALHEELPEFGWFVRLRRVGPAALHHKVAAHALQSRDFFARGLAEVDHAEVWAGRVGLQRTHSYEVGVILLFLGSRFLAFRLLNLRACHGVREALLYAPSVALYNFLRLPCSDRSSSDHQGFKARRSPPKVV